MAKFLATLTTSAAILSGVAVQVAVLGQRACPTPDQTKPVWQTSGGSPTVSDCVTALKKLSGPCHQYNNVGSYCTSMVTVGTCKIDVCGYPGAQLDSSINRGGYLQTILNDCSSGEKVGGYPEPASCNIACKDQPYKPQFSHS